MATRPTKTGGTTTYATEVALGFDTILADEVDADFNEIYTNITDINIAAGANIATAKLAQDNGIVAGHIAPNAIGSSELADNAVDTAALADLSVTGAKLAIGATVSDTDSTFNAVSAALTGVETIYAELVADARGTSTLFLAHFTIGGGIAKFSGLTSGSITVRLRIDGTAATVDGAIIRQVVVNFSFTDGGSGTDIPWEVTLPLIVSSLAAGTHRLKLTASFTAIGSPAVVKDRTHGYFVALS